MLKILRQKMVAKVIFWALVILILPAFVLWGTGSLSGSKAKGPKYAGTIDNKKVSFEELFNAIGSTRCQIVLNYFNQPKMMDALMKDRAFLAKMAWDRLIMLREAQKYKLRASDKEVITYLNSHPIFLRAGKFDTRIYDHFLKYSVGLDARVFEEIVRENIEIKKLNDLITKDVEANEADALKAWRMENEKFNVTYVLVDPNDFPSKEDAQKRAGELYAKISESMTKEKRPFEEAVSRLGLKTGRTGVFSKSDYLEGLGEALGLVEAASSLKENELSGPIQVRKGFLIFIVSGIEKADEEKFKEKKDEYLVKALAVKREKFLEGWLRKLELTTELKISLEDYEKYLR